MKTHISRGTYAQFFWGELGLLISGKFPGKHLCQISFAMLNVLLVDLFLKNIFFHSCQLDCSTKRHGARRLWCHGTLTSATMMKPWMPLKDFRIELFHYARNTKPLITRRPRSLTNSPGNSSSPQGIPPPQPQVPKPIRGVRSHVPDKSVRFDPNHWHLPVYTKTRQTCKCCSRKGHIIRSHVLCEVCKVHLCLHAGKNCFREYHKLVA